jgi:iron(III) transport system permease protein
MLGAPARWTVLTVLVWQRLTGPGTSGLAQAALLALLLALLAAFGLLVARLVRRAARPLPAGRPLTPLPLGAARWPLAILIGGYLMLVLVVPALALVATAFAPAMGRTPVLSWDTAAALVSWLVRQGSVAEALRNSLLLSLAAGFLLALAAPALALLRGRRGGGIVAAVELPYALPGTVTAVAMILVALGLPAGIGAALYGTVALILLAYLVRFTALALRPAEAALRALDPRLQEAAAGLGAGPVGRLRHVLVPLLAPALVAGAALVALTAVNEVTVSALLYAAGSRTLGVLVFGLNEGGETRLAASVSLLSLLLVAVLMALVTLAGRRLPPGAIPWRV